MKSNTLVNKVRRKWERVLSRHIPLNTKYRPSGIISLKSPGNNNGIEYIMLSPPYVSRLDLSDHFRRSCSHYRQPVTEVPYPGDYIAKINKGRVLLDTGSNMAIVSGTNNLIDEVSFQWKSDKVLEARQNAFLRQKGFRKPRHYAGKVYSLLAGGGAKTYFYHWMVDSIPRLALLQQSGLFDHVDFFLVPNYELPYQREFLKYFGIDEDRIINGNSVTHIRADCLIVSSYTVIKTHHPRWMCDWLYNSFIPGEENGNNERLIYVARGDARRNRKVINEQEVISVLRGYGFGICYLSGMSIKEQSRLFNSARMVVAAHGAGLTNLVFCRPGTRVLELFPETYVTHTYYDISNKRGLHYNFLLCPADGDADNAVEGQKINLTVNIPELEARVKEIMEQ